MDKSKENRAIKYLKSFEPLNDPYYGCYSGGKDSDAIAILMELAGVKHELVHNLTTVDAPETVRYIKSNPNVRIEKPETTMWKLIEKKMIPPTRLIRYCCSTFKEQGGKGRVKVTGVRWAESQNRTKNSGLVQVIGKPKTMQEKAEDMNVNFQLTRRGDWCLTTTMTKAAAL